jgi:uncharacterized protein YerC
MFVVTTMKFYPKNEIIVQIVETLMVFKRQTLVNDQDLVHLSEELATYFSRSAIEYLSTSIIIYFVSFLNLLSLKEEATNFNSKITNQVKIKKDQLDANLILDQLKRHNKKETDLFKDSKAYKSGILLLKSIENKPKSITDLLDLNEIKHLTDKVAKAKVLYQGKAVVQKKKFISLLKRLAFAATVITLIVFSTDLLIIKRKITIIDPITQVEEIYLENTFAKLDLDDPVKPGFSRSLVSHPMTACSTAG